jgi:predicted transcriptional regulator of viral defense system
MCSTPEPIHVTVPGSPDDPRTQTSPEGVVIHHVPDLHPDDVTTLNGIPVTTVARTLVDLAECMSQDELRETFETARRKGLLNIDDVRASRARVEWRPSLAMLDEVIAEFDD